MSLRKTIAMIALVLATSAPALAAPEVGKPAPVIETTDVHGENFNLADHKGSIVVLEWSNHECPFVKKHYESGNMQKLQETATADGVKWVTILSSAPGRQGHVSDAKALEIAAEKGAHPTTILRDESGTIGRLYGAATTPHMFVIDKEGTLVYAGAIDSNSSPRQETIEGATNYVTQALKSLKEGTPIETATSQAYGCPVKYAN